VHPAGVVASNSLFLGSYPTYCFAVSYSEL